ncbi:MAG: esterase-like activity of phytase family protein [Chroococcidiopsidaceae cyanobacterium CP_BM_ER_R8_30]|nr:esterase-like activity of phytase family protein [Chroococcidiopsidaceae cyanobacterium CP_BM_ER_R8_30]
MSKYRSISVFLLSLIALSIFSIFWAYPALARDRVFLDISLDFLGEYRFSNPNLDIPVGGLTAITYDRQRDRFYALSEDSQFAPSRFYTLKLTFNATGTEKIGIQKIDVESVTFLTDKDGKTYTQGTIDPEGIALSPQQTIFISDGTTPSIQEFDLTTGRLLTSLPIPDRYLPDAANGVERTKGVQDASAFASLTLNPTGTIPAIGEPIRLFTATKSALVQDREPPSSELGTKSRFLHYLIGYGPPVLIAEYLYLLDPHGIANELVELLALDQGGHFLSLEHSQERSGFNIQLFQMTTGGAIDTSRINSLKGSPRSIRSVKKKLLLDLKELDISLENLQGMALGPRLSDGTSSLLLVSNSEFAKEQATQFLLFRLNQPLRDIPQILKKTKTHM